MTTGSYFNTQIICGECDDKERAHPDFILAHEIESAEVAKGNYNFPGIGLPADL